MKLLAQALILTIIGNAAVAAQIDAIAPGSDLVIDGIPTIPASLAKNSKAYTDTFADSLIGWDPAKLEPMIIRHYSAYPWEMDVWPHAPVRPGRST
jgi:hypothetical protein